MTSKQKKNLKSIITYIAFFIILYSLFSLLGFFNNQSQPEPTVSPSTTEQPQNSEISNPEQINQHSVEVPIDGSEIVVTFLDVGNADCELIQFPNGETAMIDAGENSDGKWIVKYLQSVGITRLDYVIGTHPHADHIGGLDTVIDELDIGKIYLPRIPDEYAPSTKTYLSVLESIQKKGLKITSPKTGEIIYEDESTKFYFLNEADETLAKDNMNQYSLVTRLVFGNTSFIFTGDAEVPNEKVIINTFGNNLKSNVLKLGHHGSSTSSSEEWLQIVNPEIITIPCGKDNDYGHPHKVIMDRIAKLIPNAKIYRSDTNGIITILSDGNELIILPEK